jgi:hypothetical protein
MLKLGLSLSLTGPGAASEDFGAAIANISGGSAATSPGDGDYLLTKTATADYDNADWNSAGFAGAFDIRVRPNVTTGRYTRLGVHPDATGRASGDTDTGAIHLFFDEFSKVRITAMGAVIWTNGDGNAEANFTNDEYWWLCRDSSDVWTVKRGGTGAKASASAVSSADTALAGVAALALTGTRYFYASIFYQNETAHARIS